MNIVEVNHRKFSVSEHFSSFWKSVSDHQWEPSTFVIFDEYLDNQQTYIDMGAWIGPTVLYGAQIAHHCYAAEPDICALEVLHENLKLNPHIQQAVTLYEGCIGTTCGTVPVGTAHNFGDSSASLLVKNARQIITAKSLTFDAFVNEYNITDCNFIKIDIEGGEVLVVPTMRHYLEEHKPTLHLSVHPFLCDSYEVDIIAIVDVLTMYKYIFTDAGVMLGRDELVEMLNDRLDIAGIYSIIATDKESRCAERLHLRYRVKLAEKAINKVTKQNKKQ